MPLDPGTTLGPYAITAKIGKGGMGEVYRARDTTLDRDVALKVLPHAFTDDPDRLARFEHEAKVLASLNHPGIAAIYGIEEADDTRALVLELVEGPTLADRIAKGPIPIDEALPIAKQIAEALEAAHEAGVIHRDLKPANIKVREDGTVKVLDFGLAKALQGDANGDPSESPTLTAAATATGVIMGTAAYMSPEQARGKTVDKRSDVWAFGCVLYEIFTGQRAIPGGDVSDALVAVLTGRVDLGALPKNVPPAGHRLLRRCFEKDPKKRLRDITEGLLQLEDSLSGVSAETGTGVDSMPRLARTKQALPLTLGISAVAVVISGFALWSVTRPPAPRPVVRLPVTLPASDQLVVSNGTPAMALSPDGNTLVYVATRDGVRQLFRRPLDQLEATPIPGTDGASAPVFSPDGESIGFRVDGDLKRMPLAGGPAVTIYDGPGNATEWSWGTNDMIVLGLQAFSNPLRRIPSTGGVAETVTTLAEGEADHRQPALLPGGTALLFTVESRGDSSIAVQVLDTGERIPLFAGTSPRYLSSGHLVFAREGAVWAVPFDADRLQLTGDPVRVLEGVAIGDTGFAQFTVADSGMLAYVRGGTSSGAGSRLTGAEAATLVWVDRDGREEALPLPPRPYRSLRLSRAGRRVAVQVLEDEGATLWVYDVASAAGDPLTEGGNPMAPVWTPDGTRVIFSWNRDGLNDLYSVPVDGGGEPERLTASETFDVPTSVTPNGRTVLYVAVADPRREIWQVPFDGERTPTPVLQGEFNRGNAEVSPDGNWLAYRSNQSGQVEIYLQPYPGPGPPVKVSIDGGRAATWSTDGSQLFYWHGTRMMAVEVNADGTPGTPTELFEGDYPMGGAVRQYHVAPDGRFLLRTEEGGSSPQLVLVQNWLQELTERVPVP